jgi:hypothetical protein
MIEQFIATCFRKGAEKEKAGQYDAAFSFYETGNRTKFSQLQWDEDVEEDLHKEIVKIFTAEFINRYRLTSNSYVTPIFIVGMPRSGSTLIEQILDTHSSIVGDGEVPHLADAIIDGFEDPLIYPDDLPKLGRVGLLKMRKKYIGKLSTQQIGSKVCDKMLVNFLHVGLIAMLFPNAKIIHAKRNREDCLLSCYSKQFNKENIPFTYDRLALVNYHRRYEVMMQHWESVLVGRIHTVKYEDMVVNHETTVRNLLEAVGVEFEAECLKFYENKREVKTASRDQVNKPIYDSSIGRGRWFVEKFNDN